MIIYVVQHKEALPDGGTHDVSGYMIENSWEEARTSFRECVNDAESRATKRIGRQVERTGIVTLHEISGPWDPETGAFSGTVELVRRQKIPPGRYTDKTIF